MEVQTWFPTPARKTEAGNTPGGRAASAGREILGDRTRMERDTLREVLARMVKVRDAIRQRLLAGSGSLTDFRRYNLQTLSAEVDRLIADATADLAKLANRGYTSAAGQGNDYAAEPLRAARLNIIQGTPGADGQLVQAAFGNTVDLLTVPMQQFGTDVKVALRRVATVGGNQFEELQALRDKIGGQGFTNAQYRAERIIRTEINRVFNEATFQRLVSLGKEFPFLRKGWRYTKDSRTRNGHREAGQQYGRGSGIPIADLFQVNVYSGGRPGQAVKKIGVATMRFPVDPLASPAGRVAAAATIMCRCNAFVDFDVADYARYAKGKLANTGMVVPKPAPVPAPAPPPSAAPAAAKKLKKVPKPRAKKPVFSRAIQDMVDRAKAAAAAKTAAAAGVPILDPLALFTKPEPAPPGGLKMALDLEETKIRLQKVEYAVVLDTDGSVLWRGTDGDKASVRLPKREYMKGKVVTHNHPRGSGFSTADVEIFLAGDLAEMRAAGKFGTYSVRKNPAVQFDAGPGMRSEIVLQHSVMRAARKAHLEVLAENRRLHALGKITWEWAEQNHWKMVWEKVAKDQPSLIFSFEPWAGGGE